MKLAVFNLLPIYQTHPVKHTTYCPLKVYDSPDDIDLFTGGLSETPLQGALVGPTFACIIGIQFQKLKKCDRFWYENNDANIKFSEAQLSEIRKITLAKVVCENCDVVGDIQKSIFDQPHEFL
jgi:peroxidase